MKKQLKTLMQGDKFSFRKDGGVVYMFTGNDFKYEPEHCNRDAVELTGGYSEGDSTSLSEFGDQNQEVYILDWSDIFQ